MAKKAKKATVKKASKVVKKKGASKSSAKVGTSKKPAKKPAKTPVKTAAKKGAKKTSKKAVAVSKKAAKPGAGKAPLRRPAKTAKKVSSKGGSRAAAMGLNEGAALPMLDVADATPQAVDTPPLAGPAAPRPVSHAAFMDRMVDDADDQMRDEDVPEDDGEPALLVRDSTRPKRVTVSGPLDAKSFAIESARLLGDNHCGEILVLDLSSETKSMADYLVIGTGTSDRQMRSTLDEVADLGELTGHRSVKTNADPRATWILADFVDVVVHLFEPNTRAYYDLEMLWGDAPRIAWERS